VRKPGEKYRRVSSTEGVEEFDNPYNALRMHDDSDLVEQQGSLSQLPILPRMETMDSSAKFDAIMKRLDVLDSINDRLVNIERDLNDVKTKVRDVEESQTFLSDEMSTKVNVDEFNKLVDEVDNLANRLRRNTLILFGVPEGAEGTNEDITKSKQCSLLSRNLPKIT
jgi:hypothetical protein